MSWLLDTDVLCQPVKTNGNRAVVSWLEREQAECYTSTVVLAQVAYWIRTKEGRARTRLQAWLTQSIEAMEGRILSFNVGTAHVWADQKFLLEQAGQRMPVEDSYIAATARRHGLTIVTGNDRDFQRPGLKVFNPFKELPQA
ncbi:MAG: PIN domain-containing protein [Verrucomicrobia bacterium]|nr:PIN domain-containing protein [Verrucomicrobiota bacterium]